MDKNAIKRYAVWARRELISRVSQKALQYGITEKEIVPASAASVNSVVLSVEEIKQRKALIDQINSKGYEQVMEEVAYTWFNRFIALRFMEANGYLPSRVRVFTDENNAFKPQILTEAISLELDGLDMEKVYSLKDANNDDGLFKYLVIVQCNALSAILPKMFQRISDYTELLFPDNLLREGSAIEKMISMIPEEDWKDAVQIIGWLYQYYNSEKKDEVFAALKKNIKITKENIPAATQLFTPDWIVRYMVENSLGRLVINNLARDVWADSEKAKIDILKSKWKYFIEDAEQDPEVETQLRLYEHHKYGSGDIEPFVDSTFIDPCMGSGHILAYAFDVFIDIYRVMGWTDRDAVQRIIEKNLWGLDIDDRAAQLAYFAVMMKARQYDRRFLTRKDGDGNPDVPQPHVYTIVESNGIDPYALEYFVNGDPKLKKAIDSIIKEMKDAKEYGSIISITPVDFGALYARFDDVNEDISMTRETVLNDLLPLVQVAELMAQKYDAVVTNPPYMSSSGMTSVLANYVKNKYPDSKSDMSTVFMERAYSMSKDSGYYAMINIPVWMFIGSYEKLRYKLLRNNTFVNMTHCGRGIFGSDFGTTSFVIRKGLTGNYRANYRRLFDEPGAVDTVETKEKWFFEGKGEYCSVQDRFSVIPGSPIAYWASEPFLAAFTKGQLLRQVATSRVGLQTSNNNYFLRVWFECDKDNVFFDCTSLDDAKKSSKKWYPHNKGGAFRKWYGNQEYVIIYQYGGEELSQTDGAATIPEDYVFRSAITYSRVTAGATSFRKQPQYCIFDSACVDSFAPDNISNYLLGFLNTNVTKAYLNVIAPTINTQPGDIAKLPIIVDKSKIDAVDSIVDNCISAEKDDWDAFETSWDFKRHPLVEVISKGGVMFEHGNIYISECYQLWENECRERFNHLKSYEEELNRVFINIYGLQDELTPKVEDEDVTVRLADRKRDVRSLISYAVGCMFGRYSLDVDGLAFAGGEWDDRKYISFKADEDGIIPICDDEYFADDIVDRFVRFIQVVYGKQSLNDNLHFITDALGGNGQPKDVIRKYFMDEFYADHCSTYTVTGSGKRPIYWLFDSGKKGGFRALVYMHRYQPDTIARMRTDYVHEQQARYRTAIADLEQRIASASTSERVKLSKRLKTLQEQATEIQAYEEKIHHLADQYIAIDLDDGVKKNYAIFQDVLAKIK